MAIKVNNIKCPACGADLTVEEGRTQCFCSYCGTKVIITNENEYVYRNIDEAKVKQAETDRIIKLKKLELIEKNKSIRVKAYIVLGIIAIISFLIGGLFDFAWFLFIGLFAIIGIAYLFLFNVEHNNDDFDGEIRIPSEIGNYQSLSYQSVVAILKNAGFTNIECISLHDLRAGIIYKPNTVKSISINGRPFTLITKYSPNAKIVITYHSF